MSAIPDTLYMVDNSHYPTGHVSLPSCNTVDIIAGTIPGMSFQGLYQVCHSRTIPGMSEQGLYQVCHIRDYTMYVILGTIPGMSFLGLYQVCHSRDCTRYVISWAMPGLLYHGLY